MIGRLFRMLIDVPKPTARLVRMIGTGATAPTVDTTSGRDVTITRNSIGDYSLKFGETPGVYIGVLGWTFESAALATMKGWSMTVKTYDPVNRVVEIGLFDSTFSLVDLAVGSVLVVPILFKATAVR